MADENTSADAGNAPATVPMWRVRLLRRFTHEEFTYRPSAESITVEQAIYDEMVAEKVIDSAEPV